MDKLKQTVALTLVGLLALFAASWVLLIGPKRDEAAALREEAALQVSANSALATKLQVLKAQAKDLPKEQAKLAAVAAKIPSDPGLPALIRSLLDASNATGVELVSIAPGVPVMMAATAPQAVAPTEGAEQAPAAVSPAAGAAPAGTASVSPAGSLANIPLAVQVVGDYFEVEQFVAALEELPRALKLQNITVAPGKSPTDKTSASTEDGRSLSTTLNGFVYMAADAPMVTASAAPGAAAAPAAATAPPAAAPTAPATPAN